MMLYQTQKGQDGVSHMNRKPSQQSDRMSIASGRSGQVFAETGQKMLMKKRMQEESDYEMMSN
jgi:hypothetical protein